MSTSEADDFTPSAASLDAPERTGWSTRLSGLLCNLMSTVRSTAAGKQWFWFANGSSDCSGQRQSAGYSSSSEASQSWKFRAERNERKGTKSDPVYYNLVEDFPYRGVSKETSDDAGIYSNGHWDFHYKSHGSSNTSLITTDLFPEEDMITLAFPWENITQIEVIYIFHSIILSAKTIQFV